MKVVRNCYGYVRVSKAIQVEQGFSIEEQRKRIAAYCMANGFNLIETREELGKSGTEAKRDKRIVLTNLLNDIPPGDTLIVVALSRLSRSLTDFLKITKQLADKRCPLVVIVEQINTGNAMGKFGAVVFAAVGELETDMIRERGEAIRQMKMREGKFMGKIPYGWIRDPIERGKVYEVPEEQAVIKYIFELAMQTIDGSRVYSNYAISKRLNDINVKPPGKSKAWMPVYIDRILNRTSGPARPAEVIKTINRDQEFRAVTDRGFKATTPTYREGLNFYA